jgi:hypothetical protein
MFTLDKNGAFTLGLSEADKENIIEGYKGDDLPSRQLFPGYVARVFLTRTEKKDPMLKVLYKCTHPEFNGFPVWDNLTLTPEAAFTWVPFVEEVLGMTIAEFSKSIYPDLTRETKSGHPVTQIGKWKLEEDLIPCLFAVMYRKDKETGNRWPEIYMVTGPEEE